MDHGPEWFLPLQSLRFLRVSNGKGIRCLFWEVPHFYFLFEKFTCLITPVLPKNFLQKNHTITGLHGRKKRLVRKVKDHVIGTPRSQGGRRRG
jgi:hypothetical protein